MAKEFLKVYNISQETAYASGVTPLMKLAALNSTVKFRNQFPVQPNRTKNVNDTYIIQRLKRVKAKDAVDTITKGAGTNYTAILDNASDIDWESIATKPSTPRQISLRFFKNSKFDVSDMGDANAQELAGLVKNRLIEMEENAEAKVYAAGTLSATKLTADGTTANAEKIAHEIKTAVRNLQLLVDDFKAYDSNIVVFVHPIIADELNLLNGIEWNKTGDKFAANPQSFVMSGITFYVSNILNTIVGTAATEVAGAVVMSSEAYANMGINTGLVQIDETVINERVVGALYNSLDIVLDPARIATFEMTLPTGIAKSKKVNA